jgi:NitT/TauT family transport system substrate-binding protein
MVAASDGGADALRIYGNLSLLEIAPVLLAASAHYAGKTRLEHGGVMNLWGGASDLASLSSTGICDVACNSETQILRGVFLKPDLRIIFTVAECPYRIVARRSAGIRGLADLRGKRIGTQAGSSAEYFLDRMLRTVGASADAVTIVPYMAKTVTPLTQLPHALRNAELDAFTVWEPQLQKAVGMLGEDAIVFCDASVYSEQFCLCSSQAKLADAALRPKIVAFVRALIAATQALQRDPRAAQRLVAETAGLDLQTVTDAWPHLTYPGTLTPHLLDVLTPVEAWLAGHTKRAPATREALAKQVDDSVLREARGG